VDESSTESGIASTKKRGIMKTANLMSTKKLTPVSAAILDSRNICCMRSVDISRVILRINAMASSRRIYLSMIFSMGLL
jgi:hypothetical protein